MKNKNNLALGMCFGVVFGLLIKNIGVGIALGVCFGLIFSRKEQDDNSPE